MDDYAPSHYKLIKRIGEGVHGVVFRAIDLTNNKDVAIKKISLRTRHGDLSINAIREIKVLQYCDHKNVDFGLFVSINILLNSHINRF